MENRSNYSSAQTVYKSFDERCYYVAVFVNVKGCDINSRKTYLI